LQALPLLRPHLFTSDLARMVASVQTDLAIVAADLNLTHLKALIHTGLGQDR